MCLLLFVLLLLSSYSSTLFTEAKECDLSATSHFIFNLSLLPPLIPNTPYSDNMKASYVEQAMTGLLLGDGGLVKKHKGGGTYFKFSQGTVHLDYLNHVFSLFKDLGIVLMNAPSQGQSKVNGVVYTWYQFSTQYLSSWNSLRALWYVDGVVPLNIFDLLTPISLAYWMMDDGGKNGKGFHFATNAFSEADVNLLTKVLQDKFGLKCSIHSRNRIYIWASSTTQLSNIVRPYVHSSMTYKID